ncbi:MAG: Rrf2 family transcriptional regulator [Phycisphaerales bacterium]|jgi:Rrf2 family protein|nr:Rrf2 family transcriptional regulator [Phycisphaerales bacterium]
MIGRNAQLGIAALVVLSKSEGRLSATEIAEASGLSGPSVAKVLSSLRSANVIDSIPGPGGGFMLAKAPEEISVLSICDFFESETAMPDPCAITCGCSEETPCKVCEALVQVDSLRMDTLREMNIAQIAAV